MFKRKTVFVVGAGGSFELGLPVGEGLTKKIADKLSYPRSSTLVDGVFDDAMAVLASKDKSLDMREWRAIARDISNSMPLALSIDNYLHTHSHDPRIIAIGKLAIARCILEAEESSHINFGLNEPINFALMQNPLGAPKREPSWHNTFFKMLTENVKRNELEGVFQNVSFITFNYDRCIEHYLINAFAQYMKMPMPDARSLCLGLEVIHPYGKVGDLSGGQGTFVAYGAELQREQLVAASKQIRTFTERVVEEDMIDLMTTRLTEASNIVFLGFSYGEMNLELLQGKGQNSSKNVVGTALGMSESNRKYVDERLRQSLKLAHPAQLPMSLVNATCSQTINDFSRLLLR